MTRKGNHVTEINSRSPKDMILCFSGGVDSLIAWYYLGKPQSIFFDYTNYSFVELDSARKLNNDLIINKSLNLAEFEERGSAYILNRNLLFASIASNYGSTVVIAGLKDDMVEDKNPQAFQLMSQTLSLTSKKIINVMSPFWNMTKSDVVKWFLDNVPDAEHLLKISVSCYSDSSKSNCSMCPSCFRKACALWDNGIKTHFKDESMMHYYYSRALGGMYDKARNHSIMKFAEEHNKWRIENGYICRS